jgi:hypothetical protein
VSRPTESSGPPAGAADGHPDAEEPRRERGIAAPGAAPDDGVCRGCQQAYAAGESVVEFIRLGRPESAEVWHFACWQRARQ